MNDKNAKYEQSICSVLFSRRCLCKPCVLIAWGLVTPTLLIIIRLADITATNAVSVNISIYE